MSERNTRYLLDKLVASGELKIEKNSGPRGCNLFTLQTLQGGCKIREGGCKKPRLGGAIAIAPEPSIEPLNRTVLGTGVITSREDGETSPEETSSSSQHSGHQVAEDVTEAEVIEERNHTIQEPSPPRPAKLPRTHPVVQAVCRATGINLTAHCTEREQKTAVADASAKFIADGIEPDGIDECARRLRLLWPFSKGEPIPPHELVARYYPTMNTEAPNDTRKQFLSGPEKQAIIHEQWRDLGARCLAAAAAEPDDAGSSGDDNPYALRIRSRLANRFDRNGYGASVDSRVRAQRSHLELTAGTV
jgi:hypothetical protein